jgi:hypothetical protein
MRKHRSIHRASLTWVLIFCNQLSPRPFSPAASIQGQLGSGKAQLAGPLSDPKATFKVGPMNGRQARESGLRLKAQVAPLSTVPDCQRFRSTPSCPSRPVGTAENAGKPTVGAGRDAPVAVIHSPLALAQNEASAEDEGLAERTAGIKSAKKTGCHGVRSQVSTEPVSKLLRPTGGGSPSPVSTRFMLNGYGSAVSLPLN